VFLKVVPQAGRRFGYLAETYRDSATVKTRYFHSFGPVDDEQIAALRHWLKEWTSLPPGSLPPGATAPPTVFEFEENLPSFRLGVPALGHALFLQLGLRTILNTAFAGVDHKGLRIDLSEVMVVNRLDDPASKLALWQEWYPRTALPHLLGLPASGWDEDDLYDTLDVIDRRRDRIELQVYERIVRPLEGGVTKVLMKDLTSSYFEGSGISNSLSAKGYSRDRIRGSRQVNWSLVLTPKGFPVTLEVYPGNTKDETTVAGTVDRVRKVFGLQSGTFVGDRGMLTDTNLKLLHAAGFHYVVAETLWNEKEVLAEAAKKSRAPLDPIRRSEKGHQTRLEVGTPISEPEELEESWCEVVGKDGRRHIVIFSEAKRREEWATLREHLAAGRSIEKWGRAGVRRGDWTEANHHELVKSVTKQLVREGADLLYEVEWDQDTVGGLNLVVNRERKQWEETKAGWWMLTTDTELSGPEVVKVYKSLAVVERAFRTIKGPIEVRPIRHWKAERIRAHLYLCVLAYLLERYVEQKVREGADRPIAVTGEAAWGLFKEVRWQQVGLKGTDIRRWTVSNITGEHRVVLDRLGLTENDLRPSQGAL
jgi:hypothetical protein